jgi:hypothetical protein
MKKTDSFIIYGLTTPELREKVQAALFQLHFMWPDEEDDSQTIVEDDEMYFICSERSDNEFIFYGQESVFREESLQYYDHAISGQDFLSKF